jgi:competence protein ComEA
VDTNQSPADRLLQLTGDLELLEDLDSSAPVLVTEPPDAPDAMEPEPEPVRRTVKEFARNHLGALVVVLVVGVLFAFMQFSRARSESVPVATTPAQASADASPSGAVSAPVSPEAQIRIHVLGAVNTPGVVALPSGSRVEDAIRAAGGLRTDADPGQLNLAAALQDGQQIVIGTRGQPAGQVNGGSAGAAQTGGSAGVTSGKISLNSATEAQLESLPGVGPVMAGKIVAYRQQNGPFTSVDQLKEVKGIGDKTFAQIKDHVQL